MVSTDEVVLSASPLMWSWYLLSLWQRWQYLFFTFCKLQHKTKKSLFLCNTLVWKLLPQSRGKLSAYPCSSGVLKSPGTAVTAGERVQRNFCASWKQKFVVNFKPGDFYWCGASQNKGTSSSVPGVWGWEPTACESSYTCKSRRIYDILSIPCGLPRIPSFLQRTWFEHLIFAEIKKPHQTMDQCNFSPLSNSVYGKQCWFMCISVSLFLFPFFFIHYNLQ